LLNSAATQLVTSPKASAAELEAIAALLASCDIDHKIYDAPGMESNTPSAAAGKEKKTRSSWIDDWTEVGLGKGLTGRKLYDFLYRKCREEANAKRLHLPSPRTIRERAVKLIEKKKGQTRQPVNA
jgi:hypothetical protein